MEYKYLIIKPGYVYTLPVYIKIEFKNERLSLSGVIGPMRNGDCKGSCGQILDEILNITEYAKGWNPEKVLKLYEYWKEYHLNDCTAGTPAQEKAVKIFISKYKYEYTTVCNFLKTMNLYEVPVKSAQRYSKHKLTGKTYRYGSAWLIRKVPVRVMNWLFNLPESDTKPAWV